MYVTAQDKLGCFQSKPISGLSNHDDSITPEKSTSHS